jgi:RNA polymerase sigma-70 factor, ECF subfamily
LHCISHAGQSAADVSDDCQLVEAARQGDRSAYGRLYDRYARMVHGILLAHVPLNDVDDLVQDVFLQALPRLHSLRDVTRFGAWLAAITRNRANDYHRQSIDEVELPDDLSANESGGKPTSRLDDAETASILTAVRSLPETYREPLLLRLVEGMTGPEIAERTGLTAGSVRVNLHRGMQQLREKLQARRGMTHE